ncbi:MAG: hypothetical protein HZB26_20025 [Candidatus Hydrogenedentes bacterium]|nr:hypothetical protein [Candidatus Hydrogenedentota bacterium]
MWKFIVVPAGTLVLFIVLSVVGNAIESQGLITSPEERAKAESIAITAAFVLFLVLGYSVVPLFVRVFILGQVKIGNGEFPPVKALRRHEKYFVFGVWAFFTIGLLIAFPAMVADGFFQVAPASK